MGNERGTTRVHEQFVIDSPALRAKSAANAEAQVVEAPVPNDPASPPAPCQSNPPDDGLTELGRAALAQQRAASKKGVVTADCQILSVGTGYECAPRCQKAPSRSLSVHAGVRWPGVIGCLFLIFTSVHRISSI